MPKDEQIIRLEEANIFLNSASQKKYLAAPNKIGSILVSKDAPVPKGYKRCGRCGDVLKLFLFNRNKMAKTNCTGNCKSCQKLAAQKSYKKNKGKRNHKKYYQENKEAKREQGREYYQKNKDAILAKQKEYHQTAAGKKVMATSHGKRKQSLATNKGIPYTRGQVIDRDTPTGTPHAICYLCGKPIEEKPILQIDHVIPVNIGGIDCFSNVASTHKKCNLSRVKDARNLTPKTIAIIVQRTEDYMEAHAADFA